MAKVYLDTNYFIDIAERDTNKRHMLDQKDVCVSPLSFHIFFYTYKHRVPFKQMSEFKKGFEIVNLTNKILTLSLEGPTRDLEDNIQLHSAATAECDFFLTNDKKLLNMKFFGKTKIASTL